MLWHRINKFFGLQNINDWFHSPSLAVKSSRLILKHKCKQKWETSLKVRCRFNHQPLFNIFLLARSKWKPWEHVEAYLFRACYNKGHYYLGLAETQKQVGKWEIFIEEKGKASGTFWLERRENREAGSYWPGPDYSELVATEVVTQESYCHLVWPLFLCIFCLSLES